MGMLCRGLDDASLDVLLAELTAAYRGVILGGGVSIVWGEGRKIEYTAANKTEIRRELEAAQREKSRRDPNYRPPVLMVEF